MQLTPDVGQVPERVAVLRLLPCYAAAGVVYGLMAYGANSILPSLVLHFIGDVALFTLRSLHIHFGAGPADAAWQNAWGILAVASSVVLALLSVRAFGRLLLRGCVADASPQLAPGQHH